MDRTGHNAYLAEEIERGEWNLIGRPHACDGFSAKKGKTKRRTMRQSEVLHDRMQVFLRSLWEKTRSLYGDAYDETMHISVGDALEAEGHAAPTRVPPAAVLRWVREGSR